MLTRILCTVLVFVCTICANPARSQYIFADTNGDGLSSSQDQLAAAGPTNIDIWLQTDTNRDGSPVRLALGAPPLSIFAYEFVLAAVGGTVTWGKYTNLQPTMYVPFRQFENESEICMGYGGIVPLPPGKHKLGTLSVTVKSGTPRLEFRTRSSIHAAALTAFGAKNPGKDDDNALKFTSDRTQLGSPLADVSGDWADADGVAGSTAGAALAAAHPRDVGLKFSVAAKPNPGRSGAMRLSITTTRPGALHVRLFDIQGRLVQTLVSENRAPAGSRTVDVGKSGPSAHLIASGIYLYRVDSIDGQKVGRIVLLR